MKKLLMILIVPLMIHAEDNFPERNMSSYDSQNPKTGEQVTCFPNTQVQKWKKRKKVEPKVVEKIVEKIVVKDPKKNNLSILVGRTQTGLLAHAPNNQLLRASTTGEVDFGLMYQRSLGKNFRVEAVGTYRGSFYGGVGYDFNFLGE